MSRNRQTDAKAEAQEGPTASEVVAALMRLLHTVRRRHYAQFADYELSGPRTRLLAALAAQHPVRMGDLAARLGLSARTITALVDALEQEGLLARRPDPTDRRAILIDLTERGCEYSAQVSAALQELSEEILAPLNGNERGQLLGLLHRLQAASGGAECGPECT